MDSYSQLSSFHEIDETSLVLIDGGRPSSFGEFVGYWACVAYFSVVEAISEASQAYKDNPSLTAGRISGRQFAYS